MKPGWLIQRQPGDGASLLNDWPAGINRYGDPCGVYYPDLLALAGKL